VTVVTPQTLWSLNNRRALGQAVQFAGRLVREAGADVGACVERAWLIALARRPTDGERADALALVGALADASSASAPLDNPPAELAKLPPQQAAALAKLCLAIFNLNEFVFID
jgi:hypothetical protein